MFLNRFDAGYRLARKLRRHSWRDPLVLAIPRGGVAVGAALAAGLSADLDIILARKLRAPGMPEISIGALGEDGVVYLDPDLEEWLTHLPDYLAREIRSQSDEIAHRKHLFRGDRPAVDITGRSICVTDDGIGTGATMLAALKTLAAQKPSEVIVAVPVAGAEQMLRIKKECDRLICLQPVADLWSLAQYYKDFRSITDEQVVSLLRAHWETPAPTTLRG